MTHHLWMLIPDWTSYKAMMESFSFWSGVDLFLVISGFVIGRELLKIAGPKQTRIRFWIALRSFWIRRAFRILPTAWFWIIAAIALCAFFNRSGAFGTLNNTFGEGLAALLQTQNLRHRETFFNFFTYSGALGHYWSLSLEEQFYLFMPFLVFFAGKRIVPVLIALTAVQFLTPRGPGDWMWDLRTDALMIGVLIAKASEGKTFLLFRPAFLSAKWISNAAFATALLCLAALPGGFHITPLYTGMIALVSAGLVFAAAHNQNYFVPREPFRTILLWIGARSFALYIVHPIMFYCDRELFYRIGWAPESSSSKLALFILIAAASVLTAAEMNYRFIEVPLRRRGRVIAQRLEHMTVPAQCEQVAG
jgi:peptidoglycan/LPS O-acetylase OafA/YrhL